MSNRGAEPGSQVEHHGYSPDIVERFVENQSRDIELRAEQQSNEYELRRLELESSHDYAQEALQAQERDRENERIHSRKQLTNKLIASGVFGLIFICFLGYSVYLGREELAQELVKLAAVFFGGGGVGYYFGASLKDKQDSSNN